MNICMCGAEAAYPHDPLCPFPFFGSDKKKQEEWLAKWEEARQATMFKDCRVEAESVEDFLQRYYRHDRYHGRGDEYAAVVLASHKKDFAEQGYTIISRYESVTGAVVAYFDSGPTEQAVSQS